MNKCLSCNFMHTLLACNENYSLLFHILVMCVAWSYKCPDRQQWSEALAHGFYAKIHVSMYAAGGQLTPNP